jgi:transcriptional regulator with XRE-family HTH domain
MHLATIVPNVVKVPGLARCRSAATLSQRELAEKAGVSHVTIARLEGGHDAHPRTIRKLASALGVDPADLQRQPPTS